MIVFDSSALLTVVKKERGADIVEAAFGDASISVVNLTEVLSKVSDWGLDANAYVKNLATLQLEFVDFNFERAVLRRVCVQQRGVRPITRGSRVSCSCH